MTIKDLSGIIIVLLGPITLVLTAIFLYKVQRLFAYLEQKHPSEWERLGRFTLL